MISSTVNGCSFLITCLWLNLAVSTQQLRSDTPAFFDFDTTQHVLPQNLELDQSLQNPSKIDEYKHDAVITVIATVWAVCHACVVANSSDFDKHSGQCFALRHRRIVATRRDRRARDLDDRRKDAEAVAR